jgi:glycosyltransferase involved in cell wall biosynthesis
MPFVFNPVNTPHHKHAPKPVHNRIVTSYFEKKYWRFTTENPVLGVTLMPWFVLVQVFLTLPALLMARRTFRKMQRTPDDPRVVFWTDTLDEVNGIANNIRLTVKKQMDKGRKAHLIGAVHRSREGGRIENGYVILFPLIFAMPQLGYPDSELSVPHIKPILEWFLKNPPDAVELETPNPGSWVVMFICKVLGIPVISHYRTDANGYTRMLVKVKFVHWYVRLAVWIFSRMTTPVIVPSTDFRDIVIREAGIKPSKVVILPRGINLGHFSPDHRKANYWPKYSKAGKAVRFLFVGRISLEKSLPFQEEVWRVFREQCPEAELMIVGHGPYLDEMRERMKDCPEVTFTGQLSGDPLYSVFAEADFFSFVSGNDTFGNVIVESLASGTPAIISDRGGPKDIVEGTDCGLILPFRDHDAWVRGMIKAVHLKMDNPAGFEELRVRCVEHSKIFTLDAACDAQWDFMRRLAKREV